MLLVLDDFISNPEVVEALKADTGFFPRTVDEHNPDEIGFTLNGYHDEACDCVAPYMWWDGWWVEPANTWRKFVIETIWSSPGMLPYELDEVAGFEYWCRSYEAGQFLKHHVDEDTFLYEKNREFNAPSIGCIWYGFSESGDGGFLELHEGRIEGNPIDALEKAHMDSLLSPPEKRERIAYRPNRLVVFDAGRRIHETKPAGWGTREVMVVNVWLKEAPPLALETGQFYLEEVEEEYE